METPSPYQTPSSELTQADAAEDTIDIIPAGKWRRFFNLLIDYVGTTLLGLILGITVGLLFGQQGAEALTSIPELALGILITLTYYIVMESLFGQTLGKLITGTRVVNEEGQKATFGQIIGRTFARFIPFEAFSFLGTTGRGWHDSLTRTYVIQVR